MLIATSGAFALPARALDQSGPILFLNLPVSRFNHSRFKHSRWE